MVSFTQFAPAIDSWIIDMWVGNMNGSCHSVCEYAQDPICGRWYCLRSSWTEAEPQVNRVSRLKTWSCWTSFLMQDLVRETSPGPSSQSTRFRCRPNTPPRSLIEDAVAISPRS